MDTIRLWGKRVKTWAHRHSKALIIAGSITGPIVLFHLWLSLTNPYNSLNIVQLPYTTSVQNGQITYHKNFNLSVYSGSLAQALGYYKSGFLILQNTYFGSAPAQGQTADDIINSIHNQRFDPSKPYLISGDSFSVLYPRNLGVFYNSVLDPLTARSQTDWENRQRIYLQSVLYALDAFSHERILTTTIVPIGPHSAALTEVHPGSVPSDSLYGILYALQAMQSQAQSGPYKLQTIDAAKQIISERRADLAMLLSIYLNQVQDAKTGLVRQDVKLAAARDGVTRTSSFYDNVILWKTLRLASDLGIATTPDSELESIREAILNTYWNAKEGHFNDDVTGNNYSSDWLIALPTGFLHPESLADLPYLTKSIEYIHAEHIADPFPIKYRAKAETADVPWAVKTFVPNYGGDAIWSYWGAQYMTLLAQLGPNYQAELTKDIATYRQKMVETHGFPETFTPQGEFLQNAVYKSIRQTGWVVQFEEVLAQEKTTTTAE